ncbi:hypothetical protein ACWDXT_32080 [Streptomyces sp. NPDC003236]
MVLAGAARWWAVVTAVVTGAGTAGLVWLALAGDLDTAGQAASVTGAVAGLAALLVSVLALLRGDGGGSTPGRQVRAGRGGIAVGGDITGSALGKNSKVTGPPTTPRSTATPVREGDDVRAGRDGIAAGGDVTDSALGEGSGR